MNEENLEIKVGYNSISKLRDILKDYIEIYTVDGKYEGEIKHLIKYKECLEYLKNNL